MAVWLFVLIRQLPPQNLTGTPMASVYKRRKMTVSEDNRILIVDDEVNLAEMISAWLSREGFICESANHVDDAIEKLRRDSFTLVISDIMMPDKSGMELLKIMQEEFPETAIIMATAVDSRETAMKSLELGAFGYLIKPFDRNEFIINIINALERRRSILERENYEETLENEVRARTMDLKNREEEIALRLVSASGYRDEETGEHIKRLGLYGAVLALRLRWSKEQIDYMRIAGPMHDVGKIGIPDNILLKPGKLTDAEFKVIKQHSRIGAEILKNSDIPLIQMAYEIALYHHEKWDGSGYPEGLSGNDIPEAAQIVAIADVYDALSNDRVYRKALPEEEVLKIMHKGNGSHFNPLLYDYFLDHLPDFRTILAEHGDKAREDKLVAGD